MPCGPPRKSDVAPLLSYIDRTVSTLLAQMDAAAEEQPAEGEAAHVAAHRAAFLSL